MGDMTVRFFHVVAVLCGLLIFSAVTLSARTIDITILHTTDLHGHIFPTTDYDGRTNVGGFLRSAHRIDQIRASRSNTVLIDCGDTFQGSPESFLTKGRLLVDGLNQLRYDAWVLGNHEFDWGVETLRSLHDQAEIPFLACNLYFASKEANWLPNIQPFVIREMDGIRIAIVGLVTPGIPRWSRPHLLNGAMFKSSVEALQETMPIVKSHNPDIIIVAAHQGVSHRGDNFANQIYAIAREFPEIDVMLGGHSHTPVADQRMGDILYAQAGYHGIWLGRIELQYDTVQRKVTKKEGVLELMDEEVPFHDKLMERWKRDLDRAEKELSKRIGSSKTTVSPLADAYGHSSMQYLIGKAIQQGVKSELVLHGSLSGHTLSPGPITYRDIWKIVPYENTIGIAALTARQIREILAENFSRPVTNHTMGAVGFTFEIQRTGRSTKISNLRDEAGIPLHPRKRYRVAMNSYVLASGGERYLQTRSLVEEPQSRLEVLDVDTRSLVVDYIKLNSPITRELLIPSHHKTDEDHHVTSP